MSDENKIEEWIPDVEESKKLYEYFLEKYPLERLKELTLEEYTNSDKNSFCYMLEFGLKGLGSIKGSSSFKFGIYRYNKRPTDERGCLSDEQYAWYSRYGMNSRDAFENIRNNIFEVANAAKEFNLEKIDSVDLSKMVKWKIAFLYSNYRLINIFSEDVLRYLSKKYGLLNADAASFSEMYRFLLRYRNDDNIFEFSSKLWNEWLKGRSDKKYYAVGASFKSGNEDMTGDFITSRKWYDGYASNGDNRNQKIIDEIKEGDVFLLKSSATKGVNHDITFTRLKRVGVVVDRENDFTFNVNWLKLDEIPKDFDNVSYRKTIEIMRDDEMLRFVKNIMNNNMTMNSDNINNNNNKYQEYIDILEANKNLILNGAPGTGKTWLAKKIAKKMGCSDNEIGFVQFHPSYDYTDFVEGLRPVEEDGNVGFERKDGVFKKFCKRAISLQTKDNIQRPSDNENNEAADNAQRWSDNEINNAIETFKLDLKSKGHIEVESFRDNSDDVFRFSLTNRGTICVENKDPHPMSNKKILGYISKGKFAPKDTYTPTIGNYIKNNYLIRRVDNSNSSLNNNSPKKKFVFIIDEINRGEISKIFGELFYCIDPGYRGPKGRVLTQYQNLVPKGDVFDEKKKGFYVPENVYIIGTMNDIDRSVESMDFAFRRRFAFVEIKAEDTLSMLDELNDESLKEKAINRLKNLNNAISKIDGLSSAYHIGASYFLKLNNYGGNFEDLWNYHLDGLLKEYLRGMRDVEEKIKDLKKAYDNESAPNN